MVRKRKLMLVLTIVILLLLIGYLFSKFLFNIPVDEKIESTTLINWLNIG